jgi:hypothetical protein
MRRHRAEVPIKSLKGMRWKLLKDRSNLKPQPRAAGAPDALIARLATVRTARAWQYKRAVARHPAAQAD